MVGGGDLPGGGEMVRWVGGESFLRHLSNTSSMASIPKILTTTARDFGSVLLWRLSVTSSVASGLEIST